MPQEALLASSTPSLFSHILELALDNTIFGLFFQFATKILSRFHSIMPTPTSSRAGVHDVVWARAYGALTSPQLGQVSALFMHLNKALLYEYSNKVHWIWRIFFPSGISQLCPMPANFLVTLHQLILYRPWLQCPSLDKHSVITHFLQ